MTEYGPKAIGVMVALLVALTIAGCAECIVGKSLDKRNLDAASE